MIAEFLAQWAGPDELWAKVTTERWGKARANNMYRYGSVLRSGARATFGVTRCEKGIVGQVLLPPQDERVTLSLTRLGPY